jgi:hypothetical protein
MSAARLIRVIVDADGAARRPEGRAGIVVLMLCALAVGVGAWMWGG